MCARHPFFLVPCGNTWPLVCGLDLQYWTPGSGVSVFLQGWRGCSQNELCDCQQCASIKALGISVMIVKKKKIYFRLLYYDHVHVLALTFSFSWLDSWIVGVTVILFTFWKTRVEQRTGWFLAMQCWWCSQFRTSTSLYLAAIAQLNYDYVMSTPNSIFFFFLCEQ